MSKKLNRLFSPLRRLVCGQRRKEDMSRSVLLLRLENVEALNAALSKVAMGHLLVQLSMTLGGAVRPYDPVQILAPGLYAVVLRNRTDRDSLQVAKRLHEQAQNPLVYSDQTILPVLTGILIHADQPNLPAVPDLIGNAQQRMSLVNDLELGRLRLHPYDPTLCDSKLAATVSDAVVAGQIEAWFQPQISCHTGQVTGFEALARWNHPTRGILAPGAFMPQMSSADHKTLTLFMLAQCMSALNSWDRDGFDVPTVSINISNCELSDRGFADCLLWDLDRHEIPTKRLVVEVLESVGPVTSSNEARENLRKLAEAGCQIDLDDFGTGYASLDAIRQFGINRIKIDRSFVTACDIDGAQQRMILAILALTERLGIAALAEGVETRAEYAFLAQMGCDEVQGYAVARPMPLADTRVFLERHKDAAARLPTIAQRG
ncbi:EAL domain-containing protein [Paracoccus aestuarii]|uniref:EAL domain-containing protein n=1 Tax=Paracoccus aestuarii TaxID=453842 RepID=A0A419A1C4_9RHOB|nr:EAL domain-containing protein [Paracoccus aestuarii]RJL06829.1 EAL domain-containing protein [Paracoccus aestuarii]WCQ99844.1 EAL domain-containing protein [Paracoccus aestuarii]